MHSRVRMASLLTLIFTSSTAFCAEASYHEQIMELGWHTLHLSSINVINGLNLTRRQAVELRKLTREVERAGGYVPDMKQTLPGDLAGMRETYTELAGVLMRGEEVSDEMTRRVMEARKVQARAVRESISQVPTPEDKGLCLRCHLSPERVRELRERRGGTAAPALEGQGYYETPRAKIETQLAHVEGALGGKPGLMKLNRLAPRVDEILSDAQKAVIGEFSCCLVPPKDLSDPARIGQAAVSDRKLELLRWVRKIPEARWADARERLIDRLLLMHTARKTGVTEDELTRERAKLRTTFEKTRRLSELEFEADKEKLCTEVGPVSAPPPAKDPQRTFKQAYFLLMPGSVEAYDALLARMKKEDR